MAKKKSKKKGAASGGSRPHAGAAVTAEVEPDSAGLAGTEATGGTALEPSVADDRTDEAERGAPTPGRAGGDGEGPPAAPPRAGGDGGRRVPVPPRASGGGFFEIYKRGQGYYTRSGTAVGVGVLTVAGANYMHEQLLGALPGDTTWALYLRVGLPLAMMLGLGFLVYWLVGVNRRSCDFMIATEGEMKKVNWTSRKAVVGSTKVVIVTVVMMGTLLFIVDAIFMSFFNTIGVLEVGEVNVLQKVWQVISSLWQ